MKSVFHTPPVFAIYVTMLVTRWLLREIGGLAAMGRINDDKARALYEVLDRSGFYEPHADRASRSGMNVTFRASDHESHLVAEAEANGLLGIAGHRSMGGVRVSLYNAVTLEETQSLCAFLREFERKHG